MKMVSDDDRIPIGYIKAYNPILIQTVLLALSLTFCTTIVTVLFFYSEMSDRAFVMFLIIVSFAQLNVTIGLYFLTYRYAKISEEPLGNLKRLAVNFKDFMGYFELVIDLGRPIFSWLRDMKEKATWKPMEPAEIREKIESLTAMLEETEGRR